MPMIVGLILALTTSVIVAAETNDNLTKYLIADVQKSQPSVSVESVVVEPVEPEPYVPWVKFNMSRPASLKATRYNSSPVPMFAMNPSTRLKKATSVNTNLFQNLSNLSTLINFNSVFTKVKGDSVIRPSMALQVILLDFSIMDRYDVNIGPSYLLVNGYNCVQIGATIKFLETPRLQNAIQNTPLKIIPVNLSGFYFYFGAGCRTDKYQEWNISLGLGVRTGN